MTFKMVQVLLIVATLTALVYSGGKNYLQHYIFYTSLEYFSPCEGLEYHYLKDYGDISGLKVEHNEDDELVLTGKVVVTKDWDDFDMRVQVYSKKYGQFVQTPFGIYRPNFCEAMKSKLEMWSQVSNEVFENITCPVKKGDYHVFNEFKPTFGVDAPKGLEGQFKAVMNFRGPKDKFCVSIIFDTVVP